MDELYINERENIRIKQREIAKAKAKAEALRQEEIRQRQDWKHKSLYLIILSGEILLCLMLTPEFHLTNTINFHSPRRRRLHQQQQQQMVSMDPQQWWEEHHLKQVVLELNWLL